MRVWKVLIETLECDKEAGMIVKDIMNGRLVDKSIVHSWYSTEDMDNIPWYGEVLSIKKNYSITYWPIESNADDPTPCFVEPAALA